MFVLEKPEKTFTPTIPKDLHHSNRKHFSYRHDIWLDLTSTQIKNGIHFYSSGHWK